MDLTRTKATSLLHAILAAAPKSGTFAAADPANDASASPPACSMGGGIGGTFYGCWARPG